jgi:peroxiredoxin
MSTTIDVPVVGSIMPEIALVSPTNSATTLLTVTSTTKALVYFMRSSTCPVCNGHIAAMVRMVAAGELQGVALVIVTPGGAAEAAKVAAKVPAGVGSVFATDTTAGLAAVGLGSSLLIQHSGSFVLAADGTVLSSRTGTNPMTSFSRSEVLAALANA